MLRDRCGSLVHDVGQVIDRQLVVSKGEDDPYPGGIGEHPEHLDSQLHELAIGLTPAYLLICIRTQIIALEPSLGLAKRLD